MDDIQYVIDENQVPIRAIEVLQEVLDYGRRRGKSGWLNMDYNEHMCHLVDHVNAFESINRGYMTPTDDESAIDHLSHAFCRLMMLYITYCKENNLHGVK